VETRDLPSAPRLFQPGEHLVAFLEPARTNSYLARTLPAGDYVELVRGRAGHVAAPTAGEVDEVAAIVARLVDTSRHPERDAARRAAAARALVFDSIAGRHPVLVEDGAAGLATLGALADTLTALEQRRLEGALDRVDLPSRIRVALVGGIGASGLRQLAPALRRLRAPSPEVLSASWDALAALGAPPTPADLEPALADEDPRLRAAAVRALLRLGKAAGVARAAEVALGDGDPVTRRAAIEALGESRLPAALPPLERCFADPDLAIRQAAGRAIVHVGGRDAAESLARLAFVAPPDAQKYAVVLLLALGVPREDALVERIRRSHPDEDVRDLLEHGLEAPHV
jgi:hypothetical protein